MTKYFLQIKYVPPPCCTWNDSTMVIKRHKETCNASEYVHLFYASVVNIHLYNRIIICCVVCGVSGVRSRSLAFTKGIMVRYTMTEICCCNGARIRVDLLLIGPTRKPCCLLTDHWWVGGQGGVGGKSLCGKLLINNQMDNVVCEWVSFLDYFSGIEKKSAPHYKPRFGLRLEIKSEILHERKVFVFVWIPIWRKRRICVNSCDKSVGLFHFFFVFVFLCLCRGHCTILIDIDNSLHTHTRTHAQYFVQSKEWRQ